MEKNKESLIQQSNSFRDKRSFVIELDNKIYRALDNQAFDDLNNFINTNLYLYKRGIKKRRKKML